MTGPSARESARLLRQRLEMGGGEVFLDGLTRAEALELVRAARRAELGRDPRTEATRGGGSADREAAPPARATSRSERPAVVARPAAP
jgi:hypothetical protein